MCLKALIFRFFNGSFPSLLICTQNDPASLQKPGRFIDKPAVVKVVLGFGQRTV
ncbi:hypothetical protein [Fibrisoma montanum]|uniref:hypothetical protein n=1 Tax=Fibrisoma montanum TaxID=2305895 RepID=UPI001314A763|nr:hypothetical protein [Fibrisoma montanum]